jgi:hypothetical protein
MGKAWHTSRLKGRVCYPKAYRTFQRISSHANLHLPHCSTHGLLASAWQEKRLPTSHCAREPQQRTAVNGVDRVTQVYVHAFMPAFASNMSCVNIYIVIHHAFLTYLVMHRAPWDIIVPDAQGGRKSGGCHHHCLQHAQAPQCHELVYTERHSQLHRVHTQSWTIHQTHREREKEIESMKDKQTGRKAWRKGG